MERTLDLSVLCHHLWEIEEHEFRFAQELNPYLMEDILPQLENEKLMNLRQVDFDQFDEDDLNMVLGWFAWKERIIDHLSSLAEKLKKIPPTSTRARTFL